MPHKKHHSKSKTKTPRSGSIDEEALAEAVGRVMQNPALNVQWIPDMVEYYVHKQAVAAMFKAIAAIPPIELYGHQLSIVLQPIEKASDNGDKQWMEKMRETNPHAHAMLVKTLHDARVARDEEPIPPQVLKDLERRKLLRSDKF